MKNEFNLTSKATLKPSKKWHPIQQINYTLLLTKVFGEPIDTADAFMYLFRRYGYPNCFSDYDKDLCAYEFHTDNEDIIVFWRLGYPGYKQYHLCAFVPWRTYYFWEKVNRQPIIDWYKALKLWARKVKGIELYDAIDVWDTDDKQKFTRRQEADVTKIRKIIPADTDPTGRLFWDYKEKQRKEIEVEFTKLTPFPAIKGGYIINSHKISENPIVLANIQHDRVLALPEDDLRRIVYFAAFNLFTSWKSPVSVRDVCFNMAGKQGDINDESVGYFDYAGYPMPVEKLVKLYKLNKE